MNKQKLVTIFLQDEKFQHGDIHEHLILELSEGWVIKEVIPTLGGTGSTYSFRAFLAVLLEK